MADAPVFHFRPAGLIKIDGAGADQRVPIIIYDVFFPCVGEAEARSEGSETNQTRHLLHAGRKVPTALWAPLPPWPCIYTVVRTFGMRCALVRVGFVLRRAARDKAT